MNGRKRPLAIALIALVVVMALVTGTLVAPGSQARTPAAAAALTPGQWAAVQTSDWLMTTQVPRAFFLPIVVHGP